MDMCVSWALAQEISVATWDKIANDFRNVAAAFPAWVEENRQEEQARDSSFGHAVGSLLGLRYGRYPRPGVTPFVWGHGGAGFSLESVEVCPSPDDVHAHDASPWLFARRAVAGFAHTTGAIHGDLLLCLLAVVRDHAPGMITINRNDYTTEDIGLGALVPKIEAFVSKVLGRPVHLPPQEGHAPFSGPASPLAPATPFARLLSVDQGGLLSFAGSPLAPDETPASTVPSDARARGP